MPFDGSIVGWDLIGDAVGTLSLDIRRKNNAMPLVTDSIIGNGSERPLLNSQIFNRKVTVSTWIAGVNAGDVIAANLSSSNATVKRLDLFLRVQRS